MFTETLELINGPRTRMSLVLGACIPMVTYGLTCIRRRTGGKVYHTGRRQIEVEGEQYGARRREVGVIVGRLAGSKFVVIEYVVGVVSGYRIHHVRGLRQAVDHDGNQRVPPVAMGV